MRITTKSTPIAAVGCATSSQRGSLRLETLTKGQSKKSAQRTLGDTDRLTGSRALEAGATPSDLRASQTIEKCGPAHVHANHSQARRTGNLQGRTTDAISRLIGYGSSLNAVLARSLVSRLPKPGIGLMASAMKWKLWTTPSGRQFSRLQVSVSTMRAIGFSLSATPTATANQAAQSMQKWPGCRGIEVTPEAWCRRMGFPPAWLNCAPSATQLSQIVRQPSSKRQCEGAG